jgi:hypothetical protein
MLCVVIKKKLNPPNQIQSKPPANNPSKMTSNPNPTTGAFVLKMKTPRWRLCVVKQAPDESASSWMLFGQNKSKSNATFQMEFKPHQETTLIKHLVNMAMTDDDETYAELRLVLVAESPAISCIESLWSLNGAEMYRARFHTPSSLCTALHQDVHMLSLSPQLPPQSQSPQSQSQSPQSPRHPMQTRSRKH